MLGWALIFFLLAILCVYLGFFSLAATIAKVLLVVFVILLIVSGIANAVRGRPPV